MQELTKLVRHNMLNFSEISKLCNHDQAVLNTVKKIYKAVSKAFLSDSSGSKVTPKNVWSISIVPAVTKWTLPVEGIVASAGGSLLLLVGNLDDENSIIQQLETHQYVISADPSNPKPGAQFNTLNESYARLLINYLRRDDFRAYRDKYGATTRLAKIWLLDNDTVMRQAKKWLTKPMTTNTVADLIEVAQSLVPNLQEIQGVFDIPDTGSHVTVRDTEGNYYILPPLLEPNTIGPVDTPFNTELLESTPNNIYHLNPNTNEYYMFGLKIVDPSVLSRLSVWAVKLYQLLNHTPASDPQTEEDWIVYDAVQYLKEFEPYGNGKIKGSLPPEGEPQVWRLE